MNDTRFRETLQHAKQYVEDHPEDAHLAIYMMRDFQELKDFDLDDLAWSFHRESYVSAKEARWFLGLIDERLDC